MDSKQLKDLLIAEALNKGICLQGNRQMQKREIKSLVDYYVANPDWCLERNFPSYDILSREFGDFQDKGVYINREFNGELISGLQTYIFHNCKGVVSVAMDYEKCTIPMLYFANNCRMRVVCRQTENQYNQVRFPIYIFGKNDISARDNRYAKFLKYKSETIL